MATSRELIFVLDRYSAEGQYDRNPEIVHNIVATRPDLILSISNPVTSALLSETRTIPIVAWTGDSVFAGFVTNLARPGGNITGVSIIVDQAGFAGKRLQLLAEAVGKLSNVRGLTVLNIDAKMKAYAEAAAEKLKITRSRPERDGLHPRH